MFKFIIIGLLAGIIGGLAGGVSSGYFISTNMPLISELGGGTGDVSVSETAGAEVIAEIVKRDPLFADIKNIYYSSNNGKRTRLIVMDFAFEVQSVEEQEHINLSAPMIKSKLLSILASDKYKHVKDQDLLTFMADNLSEDIAPLFKTVTAQSASPIVHITRLIIQ